MADLRGPRLIVTAIALQAVNCLKNSFGAGTNSQVISQVYPANRACPVHKEFGGTRDVLAVLATFGVQHGVTTNCFCLRIGEERISIAFSLTELA
jgi:hypothetical protein